MPEVAAAGIPSSSDDSDIGRQIRKWFQSSQDATADWRDEAIELYDLYSGHQFTEDEWAFMRDRANPITPIQMNRILPFIDMVVGHQIMNRNDIKYFPRKLGAAEVNELLTETIKWADEGCDAQEAVTEAFQDMLICGMGWIEIYMDFNENSEGKLVSAERISPLQMYWDEDSTKRNIMDAGHVIRAKWYPKDDAESQFPEIKQYYAMDGDPDELYPGRSQTFATDYGETGQGKMWYRRGKDEYLILQTQYLKTVSVYSDEYGKEISSKLGSRLKKLGYPVTRASKKIAYQVFSYGPHILEHTVA
ncbi:MAG: hypothetical protein ACREBU_08995, partial [Nitrososphaera sp.]